MSAEHTILLSLVVPLIGLSLAFSVEPLGMLFGALAATLWIVNSIYSIGYMRGNNEKNQTRFYICFAIAISAALGVAFADNLLTLFLCYEILTLSTYPLVSHKGDEATIRSARVYLGILLGTSIGLLLPAIIWTYSIAGTLQGGGHAGAQVAARCHGGTHSGKRAVACRGGGKGRRVHRDQGDHLCVRSGQPVLRALRRVAALCSGIHHYRRECRGAAATEP